MSASAASRSAVRASCRLPRSSSASSASIESAPSSSPASNRSSSSGSPSSSFCCPSPATQLACHGQLAGDSGSGQLNRSVVPRSGSSGSSTNDTPKSTWPWSTFAAGPSSSTSSSACSRSMSRVPAASPTVHSESSSTPSSPAREATASASWGNARCSSSWSVSSSRAADRQRPLDMLPRRTHACAAAETCS